MFSFIYHLVFWNLDFCSFWEFTVMARISNCFSPIKLQKYITVVVVVEKLFRYLSMLIDYRWDPLGLLRYLVMMWHDLVFISLLLEIWQH